MAHPRQSLTTLRRSVPTSQEWAEDTLCCEPSDMTVRPAPLTSDAAKPTVGSPASMDSASSRSVSWSTLSTLYRSASHVSTPDAWDDVGSLTMNVPWHTSSSGMSGADDVE